MSTTIPEVINGICSAVRPIYGALDLCVDVADIITEENLSGLKIASAVSKSALLALDILGIVGHHTGKISNKTLTRIKSAEFATRIIDAPIQFAKTKKNLGPKINTAQGIIHLIEKGAIGPITGILRNLCETTFYQEKNYLDEVKKNANTKRPVYKLNEDGDVVLSGYKVIDPKECEDNIILYTRIIAGLNVSETVVRFGFLEASYRIIITRTLEKILNKYQNRVQPRCIQQVNRIPLQQNPIRQVARVPQQVNQALQPNMVDIDNLFKFRQLPAIPEEFLNDKIFSKYVCLLSQCPIRFIVQDPYSVGAENPTFYEKNFIMGWLAEHASSPLNRQPLSLDQLILRPDIQKMIDGRLEFYENEVKNYLINLAQQ